MKQIVLFHMKEKLTIKKTKDNAIYPYSDFLISNLSSNINHCYDVNTGVLF